MQDGKKENFFKLLKKIELILKGIVTANKWRFFVVLLSLTVISYQFPFFVNAFITFYHNFHNKYTFEVAQKRFE